MTENSKEIDKVIEEYEREFQKDMENENKKEQKGNYIDYMCLECERDIPGSGREKLPLEECYCSDCRKKLADE